MEIYKFQQITVLIVCTLAGAICGIVYDIFRAYRRCSKPTNLKTALCDILVWAISAVIVYVTIHLSNNAELRWYEPIGVISGYVIYTLYLSTYCTGFFCKFINTFSKICNTILKLVCIPTKILHILISPIKRYSVSMKTRLLYVTENLSYQLRQKIMLAVLKKLRK